MRLGLIGPLSDRPEVLERAVSFLCSEVGVHRAVYLGLDGALDRVVSELAARLVADDPGESAVVQRAAKRCAAAPPETIDAFLGAERQRLALMVFGALPGDDTRLVELLDGKVAVMIHDKALLDEDDIASATYLVFGKSSEPTVKQIGSRFFLSPGSLKTHGIMLLEDEQRGVELTLYDSECRVARQERLVPPKGARARVG
jgi:hypothetical protein